MDDHVLFLIVVIAFVLLSVISWLKFFWDFGEAWCCRWWLNCSSGLQKPWNSILTF